MEECLREKCQLSYPSSWGPKHLDIDPLAKYTRHTLSILSLEFSSLVGGMFFLLFQPLFLIISSHSKGSKIIVHPILEYERPHVRTTCLLLGPISGIGPADPEQH